MNTRTVPSYIIMFIFLAVTLKCVPDAGIPDTSIPDAGIPDAGIPDAGIRDAGIRDASILDDAPCDGALFGCFGTCECVLGEWSCCTAKYCFPDVPPIDCAN